MGRLQRYKAAEVVGALEQARGIKAVAAKMLGCTRRTVDNYAKRYATVAQACQQARETLIDVAEEKLAEKVDEGEWPAVRYVLATLGKERGYSERQDIALQASGGVNIYLPDNQRGDTILPGGRVSEKPETGSQDEE